VGIERGRIIIAVSIWLIWGVGRHKVGGHRLRVRVCTSEGVGVLWRGLGSAKDMALLRGTLMRLGGAGGQIVELLMGALRGLGGTGRQIVQRLSCTIRKT